jgi:hypothetical protein
MDPVENPAADTQAIVRGLEELKQRARNDRRATSRPLLTFGMIAAVGAVVASDPIGLGGVYWVLSVPVGFGFLAWHRRRRAVATGIGGGREPYGWFALGFPLLCFVPYGLLLFFVPLVAIAAGLAFVAVQQRNWYLGVCAAVFGIVGTSEMPFFFISNRLYDLANALGFYKAEYGYFDWANELAIGLLAAFLLGAGLLAHFRETRQA